MAPKKAEMMENPPLASSSEEEEEESGSSGEESESSGEESNKDESSDEEGDEQPKPSQKNVAAKKIEADSEGESEYESGSESDSDSVPEPAKTEKSHNTVGAKPKPETSRSMTTKSSAVTLPESSTAKRPLKQTEEDAAKKKMKTATDEEVKKQLMFQRKFSETDEIALLQGILDFTSKKGDPQKEIDTFCDYVKKLINFNANKTQLVTKIQRLKKKFGNIVKNALKKGKTEDQIVFSKELDQKSFELSRKIWGTNGVMASKSRKVGGKPEEIKLSHPPKKVDERTKPETNTGLCFGREIASLFRVENVTAFCLDDSTITASWDMVADGPKKREMEEKWKVLKAKQVELCLQRTGLIADSAKLIFKDNASSSAM